MEKQDRILVVEDEAVVAVDLQTQLETLGYDVVSTVATAEDATAEALRLRPDLVLMDVRLGSVSDRDGVAAAAEIRQQLEIPIVFLTAFSDSQTVQRARETGAYGYLVKPFEQRELYSTIETALERGRRDRQVREHRDDLLAILDTLRQGTLTLDEDGGVNFLSRAAEKILETSQEAARGRHWTELIHTRSQGTKSLNELLASPNAAQQPLVFRLSGQSRPKVVEVEVHIDPRNPHQRFLFLYDVSQLHDLRRLLDRDARFENIVGKSDAMQQVFRLIAELGPVDATVLIEGETGTGKELVAKAIHNRSRRRERPLVALNCAGLGEDLAASQLFGHRRGAFTGAAADQAGLFEAASGGTLFLDEIGELPERVQTMLLRVLEERAVRRLGDSELRPVDVRVIAATNRGLAEEVEKGEFRADLLYRLRVCRLTLPPLRERREDLPLLARQFVGEHAAKMGKPVEKLSDAALCVLLAHHWPGNVRELRNAIEFAVIRAQHAEIQPADLPPEVLESAAAKGLLDDAGDERGRIVAALEQTGGNRREAAKLLGISRATLYRRLASLGLSPA